MFQIDLSVPRSLQRYGSCPVRALPSFLLGMSHGRSYITRYDASAGWAEQYSTTPRNMDYYVDPDPTFGYSVAQWTYLNQAAPVEWTGYYAP